MTFLLQAPLLVDPVGALPLDAQLVLLLLVKALFVIGALLYVIFAFVVVRQIHVMRSTVITPFSGVIQLLGIVHLVFAIGVVLLFMVAL